MDATGSEHVGASGRRLVPPFSGGVWVHLDATGDGVSNVRLFWLPEVDPAVVSIDAESVPPTDPDAFDIAAYPDKAELVRDLQGHELLVLDDGQHQIEFQVRSGTLSNGPVRLQCCLDLFGSLDAKLMTLSRLQAFRRLGRFPKALYPFEPSATRWSAALQAYDGMRAGASLREIAGALFSERLVTDEWNGRSGFLKARVQRLVRYGRRMVDGGYKTLLQ
jgi:hypothetical protein